MAAQYRTRAEAEAHGLGHLWGDPAAAPKVRLPKVNARGENKTEARLDDYLAHLKACGRVERYDFESVKLRLADRSWYTPDFAVWLPGGRLLFAEVKGGFVREDGLQKLKFAAETFPWPFYLCRYEGRKWAVSRMPSRATAADYIDIFGGL